MRSVRTLTLSVVLFSLVSASAQARPRADAEITVMTQNQFLGADLGPILLAIGTPNEAAVLAATLQRMAANNFPVRAEALADHICSKQPHVAGLQEVFRFSINGLSGPPAPLPFVDHLDELMAAIDDQCGNYVVAASVQNVSVVQPAPGFGNIGFTDRDVILVRDDVFYLPVPFSGNVCAPTLSGVPGVDPSGCHFQAVAPLPPAVGGAILRGYVGVDALVNGVFHRVVNTHLEVQRPDGTNASSILQALQMAELTQVLALFPKPPGARTVLLGDINSSPDDPIIPNPIQPNPFPPPFDESIVPPYAQLVIGGYSDVWFARPGNDPGATCCHDEDLSDTSVVHDERIDVVFSLEALDRSKANVMGGEDSDLILGLRPSDHCTVSAELNY
jgi:hypothetical protein